MSQVPQWMQIVAFVIAILGSAGFSSIITTWSNSRKTISEARHAEQEADKADAEARAALSMASRELIQPLVERAQDLERRLRATEQELLEAKRLAEKLTGSLREAQAEAIAVRKRVDEMSKEMASLHDENERLRSAHEEDGHGAGLQG